MVTEIENKGASLEVVYLAGGFKSYANYFFHA
jgi:hypothetical protein